MITATIIIVLIGFIVWISSRETSKSLSQIRDSENQLGIERNLLEQRIARRTEELLVAEQKRIADLESSAQFGQLSKGLLHDLMNPLSSLSLYTERLKDLEGQPREYHEAINKMTDISRRMGSFMDNLKNYTTHVHALSKREVTDFTNEILIIRDILGYKARMAKVRLIIDTPKKLELPANPMRIHQLILNLVTNAIEACEVRAITDGGEHQVIINLKQSDNVAILSVSDTGVGVQKEYLNQLFKRPFTTKVNGTGSGLMTIRSIVEDELHGQITVDSKEDGGTIFTVRIPTK